MKWLFIVFIMVVCLGINPVWAKSTSNDFEDWNVVNLEIPVTKRLKLRLDGTTVVNQNMTALTQVVGRPAIGYQLTPHISLWQGYAYLANYAEGSSEMRHENRIWQQVIIDHKYKGILLTNRFRLEERFIEDAKGTAVRGRYMLRFSKHIDKRKKWYLAASDEVLVNLNSADNGPQSGFDQNRIYAGIGRHLNEHFNIETGYQLRHRVIQKAPDQLGHGVMITLRVKL